MYAIIRTGGKQYNVSERTIVAVEKLDAEVGDSIEITDVLMVSSGDQIKIGTPTVSGAVVKAKVISTAKGKKIRGYTFKKVKDVQTRYGHRQCQTTLEIESITA